MSKNKLSSFFRGYYYNDLKLFYQFHIPKNSKILQIDGRNKNLVNFLKPKVNIICPSLNQLKDKDIFDYVILSDILVTIDDVQKLFHDLKKHCSNKTRIIINYHSLLWLPLLKLGEMLKIKIPQYRTNWLNTDDIINLLEIENYQVIKTGHRFLLPVNLGYISKIINKYFPHFPIIKHLCLSNYIIARPIKKNEKNLSVSVIVPTRNEAGNIKNVIEKIPKMGKKTEIIFVEGGSTDNTWNTIINLSRKYPDSNIKYFQQKGKGKADAVRKGFAEARGDILMILDADLTVPPSDLPKFYRAIVSNKGEYINGCRLVYPLEDEAMRMLNILGNKLFSITFSWLLDQKIKDTLCGTKVISRDNYQILKKNRKYFGDFDPFGDFDLIFGAAKMDLKFVEIPIRYQSRKYGQTNISRFKHGIILAKMVFFAINKLKFV